MLEENDLFTESVQDLINILNLKELNQNSQQKPSNKEQQSNKKDQQYQQEKVQNVQQQENKENQKDDSEFDLLMQFCNQFENKKKPENTQQQEIIPKNINQTRYMHFKPWDGILLQNIEDNGYYFKFYSGSYIKLIKGVLETNGFKETQNKDWTFLWSTCGIPPSFYQQLMAYQKINHFPKSYEITRKDLMNRNISKMAIRCGQSNFNFVPKTYLLPSEMSLFLEEAERNKGQWYIVKPSALSQGKGIFVTDNISEIVKKQNGNMVVCHYIQNPMLINDLKFDLRIYVALTSINPLKIFIYDEGLVRFATCPYNTDKNIKPSKFVHLTNYSVNKFNTNFIPNKDADDDHSGSKWSLSAFKDYLKINGYNSQLIFDRIEDVVIKTILSIENNTNNSFQQHVPYINNCFELLGFDILIDSNQKAWLLEVNLSPSLNTDSPLDLKIKGNLIADLFTLVGIVPNDQRYLSDQTHIFLQNNAFSEKQISAQLENLNNWSKYKHELSKVEKQIIKETEEELKRCRRFKRIYPNENSIKYKNFFDVERPFNVLLRNYELDKYKANNINNQNNQTSNLNNYLRNTRVTSINNQSINNQTASQILQNTLQNRNNTSKIYNNKF